MLPDPPATPEAEALYEADRTEDGYVMNLTRVWAWRPDVTEAFQAARGTLTTGSSLSARDLAVLTTAAAAALGDSYCGLAWGERLAGMAGAATAAAVLDGSRAGLTERESALARWADQVVRDPNATSSSDVDGLRTAGLSDREIFEATTWVAFRLAFSTVNDALGAIPDRELAERVPASVRAAVTYGRRDLG